MGPEGLTEDVVKEAVKNVLADFARYAFLSTKTAIFGQKTLILALFDPFF